MIIDFDFIDDYYMVLYHNDSVTDVYTTRNIIDLQHKMRLPLYRKFEHFKYLSYSNAQRPKRDYFEQTLVQVMTDAEGEKAAVLIYKFDESQHNSLYVANSSFSKLFSEAKNSWIVLTGSSENFQEHYLGMISDSRFIFL